MNPATLKPWFSTLQQTIVSHLEAFDGKLFQTDSWERPGGGGGLTRVIEEGNFFERGGVNFSHVMGEAMPASATAHRPELAGRRFEAMGVSLVRHPRNPHCPTVHMNVRHFHATCKAAILPFGGEAEYARLKDWCDRYFFLKHRNEPRGVGGLFFDDLGADGQTDFDTAFGLTQSVGNAFLPAYLPIIERRKDLAFDERERDFQAYRRGRYVEFNLVFDRGTLFGLQSGGRTESILMSMPPMVKWRYDWHPEPGSAEARLYEDYLRPRDWA